MIIRGHADVLHVATQSDECGFMNLHWDDITFAKGFVFVCYLFLLLDYSKLYLSVVCQHGMVLE